MKLGQVSVVIVDQKKKQELVAAAGRCGHFFSPAAAASKLRIDFLLKK